MIHKMYALNPYIPSQILNSFQNAYGLKVEPIKDMKVITLSFETINDGFELKGSHLSDYDSARNLSDTFYRPAPANTVSPFPSLYISEADMKKDGAYSVNSKSYSKIIRILKSNAEENPDLQALSDIFTSEANCIFEEVDKYLQERKDPFILSLEIDGLSIGRCPLYDVIRKKAIDDYYSDFFTLGKNSVEGSKLFCSMCLKPQEKLWGYVSIYNFYASKTDLAPIAGGLKREQAHNNYPVCPECAKKLKQTKPVIDQYFAFRFCGFDYLLLPEYIGGSSEKESMELIMDIMINQHAALPGDLLQTRLGSFTLGKRKPLVDNDSKEVFDYLSETKNTAAYTMLFYEASQSQFKLLASVENVFPSQFKQVFTAKEKAENHDVFKNLTGKQGQENYDLNFRFDLLKEFLPISSKKDGDFSKAFLQVSRAIFKQEQISQSFILHRIMTIIRSRFANDENHGLAARKAFLLLKFLQNLSCIKTQKYQTKKEVNMNALYEGFFAEHQDFFDSNAKKSVFMTGVLTQNLLTIQFKDKGATPFRKRLNGLKLNPALINRIFTEAREKLEQYDKNYYRELQSDIAKLMVTGGMDELTNDEISFYFTLGMTLCKEFKTTKTEDTDI